MTEIIAVSWVKQMMTILKCLNCILHGMKNATMAMWTIVREFVGEMPLADTISEEKPQGLYVRYAHCWCSKMVVMIMQWCWRYALGTMQKIWHEWNIFNSTTIFHPDTNPVRTYGKKWNQQDVLTLHHQPTTGSVMRYFAVSIIKCLLLQSGFNCVPNFFLPQVKIIPSWVCRYDFLGAQDIAAFCSQKVTMVL